MYPGLRAVVAAALLAIPSGAAAQPPLTTRWDTGASFGIMWGEGFGQDDLPYRNDDPSTAYQLDPGRYWTTHLKTDSADDTLRISPKTRVPVPLQQLAYGDIASIEKRRPPKMNPGAKVLAGAAIGVGGFFMFLAIVFANFA